MRRVPPPMKPNGNGGNGNGRRRGALPGQGNGGKGVTQAKDTGAFILPHPTKRKLTIKEARMITEFLKDPDASKGDLAIRAGYSEKTATEIGRQVFRRPHVIAEIKDQLEAFTNKERLSIERVLRYLITLADVDKRNYMNTDGTVRNLKKLSRQEAALVTGYKVKETFDEEGKWTGQVVDVKFADPLKPVEMLGRYLKAFTDTVQVNANIRTEKTVHHTISANLGIIYHELDNEEKALLHNIALKADAIEHGRTIQEIPVETVDTRDKSLMHKAEKKQSTRNTRNKRNKRKRGEGTKSPTGEKL